VEAPGFSPVNPAPLLKWALAPEAAILALTAAKAVHLSVRFSPA